MDTFARVLADRAQQSGLSLNELARAIDVDPSYLSRICRSERNPPRRPIVVRLADALGLQGLARAHLFTSAGYWPDEDLLTPLLAQLQAHLTEGVALAHEFRALLPAGAPALTYLAQTAPPPITLEAWQALVTQVAGDGGPSGRRAGEG